MNSLTIINMNVLKRTIIVMVQNPNMSAVNIANSRWMSLRTAKAPLNRRSFPSVRRTSTLLTTKSFPCTQKA